MNKIEKLKALYENVSSRYGELWSKYDIYDQRFDLIGLSAQTIETKPLSLTDYDNIWSLYLELSGLELAWLTCTKTLDKSLYGALKRLEHLIGLLELDAMISSQEVLSLYDWHEYMFTEDVKGFACNIESYEASFED